MKSFEIAAIIFPRFSTAKQPITTAVTWRRIPGPLLISSARFLSITCEYFVAICVTSMSPKSP